MALLGTGRPGDEDVARAYIDVERLLDRIRRGEVEAGELEQARLRRALEVLRDLRRDDAA